MKRLQDVMVIAAVIVGLIALLIMPFHPRLNQSRTNQPDVIMEVYDPSLIQFNAMWQTEIARRFHNAVAVVAHGGDFVQGEWISEGSSVPGHVVHVQDIVRKAQAEYPDRTIVLICCNTGHLKLGIPGVYYASASVWCVPDRAITPEMMKDATAFRTFDSGYEGTVLDASQSRWALEPDNCGNIFEFVKE